MFIFFILLALIRGTAAFALVGGTYSTDGSSLMRSTVSISVTYKTPGTTRGFMDFCTGMVLDSYHILTAAHCANSTEHGANLDHIDVRFIHSNSDHYSTFKVIKHTPHSQYVERDIQNMTPELAREVAKYDVAVLKLRDSLPDEAMPIEILSKPNILKYQKVSDGAGTGLETETFVGKVRDFKPHLKWLTMNILSVGRDGVTILTSDSPNHMHHGDSGGPGFLMPEAARVQSQMPQVWGLLSSGGPNNDGTDTAYYLNLETVRDFIASEMANY